MKEFAAPSDWGALHNEREAKRLQLVALAAEVVTVASRTLEQHAKLPTHRRDPQLERQCRALESAALQMLFPSMRSMELSDHDLDRAVALFFSYQQQAGELMARAANSAHEQISRLVDWMSSLR
jgi:hypothetical protein